MVKYSMQDIVDYWNNYYNGLLSDLNASGDELRWFNGMMDKRYKAFPDIIKFVLRGKESLHGKQVLEIGCGVGQDAVMLVNAGAKLTTIDASKVACELTSRHLASRRLKATVLNVNAEVLPIAGNSFDAVYSFGVFMHSENPQAVINEAYRVLKPGGKLKAMIYNRVSVSGFIFYYFAMKKKHTPFVSLKQAWGMTESPDTKAYTKTELLRMFKPFKQINVVPSFMMEAELFRNSPKLKPFGVFFRYLPRMAGCHLIEAIKAEG